LFAAVVIADFMPRGNPRAGYARMLEKINITKNQI
jgi:hypothetical protein